MKFRTIIAGFFVAIVFSASCARNEQDMPEYITGVSVTVEEIDFPGLDTKVSYTDRLAFSWDEGDCLGIFPVGGDQVAFPLSDIGSGTSANFDGGTWALRSSYRYAAYFPFSKENYYTEDMTVPVSYLGQKQVGDGSTAGLGEHSFLVSESTRPNKSGNVNLEMKQVGSVIKIMATIPAAVNVTAATLADKTSDMVVGGRVDLGRGHVGSEAFQPEIVDPIHAGSIMFSVENLKTVAPAEGKSNVNLYFWMAPQDLTGHRLELTLADASGNSYVLETTCTKNLIAAKGQSIDFGTLR